MKKVEKLNKDILTKLKDENVNDKERNEILEAINVRFEYIFERINQVYNRGNTWFCFDNIDEDNDIDGHFDINFYEDKIFIASDIKANRYKDTFIYDYMEEIPTSFLFEDFEDKIEQEYKEKIEKIDKDNEKKGISKEDNYFNFINEVSFINPYIEKEEFIKNIDSTLKKYGYTAFKEEDFKKLLDIIESETHNSYPNKNAGINLLKYLLHKNN